MKATQKAALESKLRALKDSKLAKEKKNLEQHRKLEMNELITEQTLKSAKTLEEMEKLNNAQNKEASKVLESDLALDSTDSVAKEAKKDDDITEEEFTQLLESSDLFSIVKNLSINQPAIYDITAPKSDEIVETLHVARISSLSQEEKIVFKFCQFILGLITDKCSVRPITLLPAEKIPTNKDLLKNAFNGWFCYDSGNRFLYISRRKLSERNPGQLYVVMAHCTAHIKTGDLSNDLSPNFRIEFYKILSEISEYIFFVRTNPKVKYPNEYSASNESLQEPLYIIRENRHMILTLPPTRGNC